MISIATTWWRAKGDLYVFSFIDKIQLFEYESVCLCFPFGTHVRSLMNEVYVRQEKHQIRVGRCYLFFLNCCRSRGPLWKAKLT